MKADKQFYIFLNKLVIFQFEDKGFGIKLGIMSLANYVL
jgi:hypothetical protein